MRVKQAKKFKETTRDRQLAWINHYVSTDFGIWIECTACKKWRKNYEYSESHEVPQNWCCTMGTLDGKAGNCDDPEENTEEEHFEYCPGSLVWARLDGYPWWPGMVDENPDIEEYFYVDSKGTRFYNVTFLDERVTHAWIPTSCMSSFHNPRPRNSCVQKQYNRYTRAINKAEERAQTAMTMTIKERLSKFSFVHLYKGKWPLADDFDGDDTDEGNIDKEDTDKEDDDNEDNPLDITDILLQEIDDLGSMTSLDADDQELIESDTNLDFLPSEKSFIEHGFDYLKEKNKPESSNTKKPSYKTKHGDNKTKKISETGVSKSEENNIFMKSLMNKEASGSSSKGKVPSFVENKTDALKRSKYSKLSAKKLKTEKSKVTLKSVNTEKVTSVKEHELIMVVDDDVGPNSNVKSATLLNNDTVNAESVEVITIGEEDINDFKAIPIENTTSNEMTTDEIDCTESNSCIQPSPLKVNRSTSEITSISNTVTNTIDETIFQDNESNFSNSLNTEYLENSIENKAPSSDSDNSNHSEKMDIVLSNNIPITNTIENKAPSSDSDNSNHSEKMGIVLSDTNTIENKVPSSDLDNSFHSEKMDTVLSHLDECITNVINYAGNETELPLLPVEVPKKMAAKTKFTSVPIKTPKKKINANKKLNGETVRNLNEPEVITKGFEHITSDTQKISKTKAMSHSKDIKHNKGINGGSTPMVKKNAKLVCRDKFPPKKDINSENFIDFSVKECKLETTVNESKPKISSTEHTNILNTGNKIKPDFKALKRPFKGPLSLKNNVANKKQCIKTQNGSSEKSFQENTAKSDDTSLCNGKTNEQFSVEDEPFIKQVVKTQDETNMKANVGLKKSDAVEFNSGKFGNDLESAPIEDEENKNSDQNVELKDKENNDEYFFDVSVSDEE